MYNVVIIDDEASSRDLLKDCLLQYAAEYSLTFNIKTYDNGSTMLFDYKMDTDLVFMDINMGMVNGLKVAKELRKIDSDVALVFVTQFAKFAIKGYEVNAFDYIVKPVCYDSLRIKMGRIVSRCDLRTQKAVMLMVTDGAVRVLLRDLYYVEIQKHKIIYHTAKKNYEAYGTLKTVEEQLPNAFCRCNSCYLVNLACVTSVKDNTVFLGSQSLKMSRSRKKEFLEAFNKYLLDGDVSRG